MSPRRILLVGRVESIETAKAAQAIAALNNSEVVTGDYSDVEGLLEAVGALRNEHGSVDRIVTAQETLLEAVALANEALGLPGLSVAAVRRTLDKSQLKATLEAAGLKTPRYQVVTHLDEARAFARQINFPIVLKSPSGSGALATFPIRSETELNQAMQTGPYLAEQYITGQELCIDTITIDNEPRFHSICCYQPSILSAIEHPETQWSCIMPRDMEPYQAFINDGLAAIRALNVGNAMTHMEGFIDTHGQAWFTDATLRPAGARIAPMLAHAYDIDPYRVWARVAVDGCFDGPWERKYAVGTIFLRGVGAGVVQHIDGIERVKQELKEMLVDVRWPRTGSSKSATYTGDGFVTVRHQNTEAVQAALSRIAQLVKITYSNDSQPVAATWQHRLKNFRELNRPAWDQAN
jgi:hypothetical protein